MLIDVWYMRTSTPANMSIRVEMFDNKMWILSTFHPSSSWGESVLRRVSMYASKQHPLSECRCVHLYIWNIWTCRPSKTLCCGHNRSKTSEGHISDALCCRHAPAISRSIQCTVQYNQTSCFVSFLVVKLASKSLSQQNAQGFLAGVCLE